MSRHAPLVRELADRLRARNVTCLAYFHTDHFEPWRPVGDAPAVGPEIVEAIHEFCRTTERIDFARRLTLFYKPHLNYALRRGGDLFRADPDDLVGFLPRSDYEERIGREAMGAVATSSAHDIQLHVHHEYYTATTGHTDREAIAWFATPLGRTLDEGRLELAIRLNREIIGRETGRFADRWFFIHGHWALNGSDDSSCTITNEIELLMRNGCRGDFTFPAGRQHTNPRIEIPYLCRAFDRPKGYDLPECEPEVACGNAEGASSKFFIWASRASNLQCSLDYMSESSRRQIENTEKAARELIDNSYVADGRLYIKTHAHSLHPYYFEHARAPVFPHQFPATQTLLSVIFEAAALAGVKVEFPTVPEVYDLLIWAKSKPAIDLVETYQRSSGRSIWSSLGRPKVAVLKAGYASVLQSAWALPWRRPQPSPGKATSKDRPVSDMAAAPTGTATRAATTAPDRDRALERVREVSARVLGQRIAALGVRGSGAYEHYSQRLAQGLVVSDAELMVLDIVRQRVPPLGSYHEIGSGLGILPFLLALNGFASVGIECDPRRHETAAAIWRELSRQPEAGASTCRLVSGRFPAAVANCDTSQALAIFTDFVTTQTAERLGAILKGLHRYPYVLIDLRRFCVVRETPVARQELIERLHTSGFEPASDLLDAADSVFVLLHNHAVEEWHPRPATWARLLPSWRGAAAKALAQR